MALVEVVRDDRCSEIFPYQFPAVLRVRTHDGRELVEEVFTTRGGPQRPLTFDDLSRKFADNAGRVLRPEAVQGIRDTCARLETLTDVDELLGPMRSLPVAGSKGGLDAHT